MSTILLQEPDAVFAAVLEDHLRVANHQVIRATTVDDAVARSRADTFDLIVLDGARPKIIDAIGELRSTPETEATPILILADDGSREARLASLRAGVDEHLARPLDLEELMLRIARLLGRRAPAPQLSGDVGGHPLPDLLQYVQQTGKTGRLAVSNNRSRGEAWFRNGQLVSAQWGRLRGSEAALAMLSMARGRFRFENSVPDSNGPGATNPLPLQQLLLHAVWLVDELSARREHLPPTGAPLRALEDFLPPEASSYGELPLARVFERVRTTQGLRLFDLIADEAEAPAATRFATAWLVQKAAITVDQTETYSVPPSTGEITSSMIFEINVSAFLMAAKRVGLNADPLPLLVVADEPCRPRVMQMLQGVHGYLQNEPLRTLVERLNGNNGASTAFDSERGRLSLHVQFLDENAHTPLDNVVPVCGGILLWLGGPALPPAARRIVERLQTSRSVARGIVIATDTAGRAATEQVTRDAGRWQLTPHEPRSLLGVLRLLEPQG